MQVYFNGTKHFNKGLMMYQVRMYKTWKHNRKHQWKEKSQNDLFI